jgi:hypothetical protein
VRPQDTQETRSRAGPVSTFPGQFLDHDMTLAYSPQGMLASYSRGETAERIRYPALSAASS